MIAIYILTVVLLAALCPGLAQQTHSCSTTRELPHKQRRGPDFTSAPGEELLCDNTISGLYRVNERIVRENPSNMRCGTISPYYVYGPDPEIFQAANLTACHGAFLECFKVLVVNCGAYFVYDLKPVNCILAPAAYCINIMGTGEFDMTTTASPVTTTEAPTTPAPPPTCDEFIGDTPWAVGIGDNNGFCDRASGTCSFARVHVTPRTPVPHIFQGNVSCCFQQIWVDERGPLIANVPFKFSIGFHAEGYSCSAIDCRIPNYIFPSTTEKKVAGWLVSLSVNNDGRYGNQKLYLPYDPRCIQCDFIDPPYNCTPRCIWKNTHCFIDGKCYSSGEMNIDNTCEVCYPGKTNTEWSVKSTHCLIAGNCVAENYPDPLDPTCRQCIPSVSQTEFSTRGQCYIDNRCYPVGYQIDMCRECNNQSLTQWTRTGFGCFKDGVCVGDGAMFNSSTCSVCNPTTGEFEDRGCVHNGLCYGDGQSPPNQACRVCNSTTKAFELRANHCFINDVCYAAGQGPLPCVLVCDPITNNFQFTGTGCAIGNSCFAHSTRNPDNSCQRCDLTTSSNAWTPATLEVHIGGSIFQFGCETVCGSISSQFDQLIQICDAIQQGLPWNGDGMCFITPTEYLINESCNQIGEFVEFYKRKRLYDFCLERYQEACPSN